VGASGAASAVPGAWISLPIECAGNAHRRLTRAEAIRSRDEMKPAAAHNVAGMIGAANWVQAGKRQAVVLPLGAGVDREFK